VRSPLILDVSIQRPFYSFASPIYQELESNTNRATELPGPPPPHVFPSFPSSFLAPLGSPGSPFALRHVPLGPNHSICHPLPIYPPTPAFQPIRSTQVETGLQSGPLQPSTLSGFLDETLWSTPISGPSVCTLRPTFPSHWFQWPFENQRIQPQAGYMPAKVPPYTAQWIASGAFGNRHLPSLLPMPPKHIGNSHLQVRPESVTILPRGVPPTPLQSFSHTLPMQQPRHVQPANRELYNLALTHHLPLSTSIDSLGREPPKAPQSVSILLEQLPPTQRQSSSRLMSSPSSTPVHGDSRQQKRELKRPRTPVNDPPNLAAGSSIMGTKRIDIYVRRPGGRKEYLGSLQKRVNGNKTNDSLPQSSVLDPVREPDFAAQKSQQASSLAPRKVAGNGKGKEKVVIAIEDSPLLEPESSQQFRGYRQTSSNAERVHSSRSTIPMCSSSPLVPSETSQPSESGRPTPLSSNDRLLRLSTNLPPLSTQDSLPRPSNSFVPINAPVNRSTNNRPSDPLYDATPPRSDSQDLPPPHPTSNRPFGPSYDATPPRSDSQDVPPPGLRWNF
jgi:hypothetical protein